MALKKRSKVNPNFSMSSMTDIVFLLLIFFMVTSTLIHPNALKLNLPQSTNQTSAKPIITVSININREYFINKTDKIAFENLETELKQRLTNNPKAYISLHADKRLPLEEVIKIMSIAKRNNYKLILATSPK